NDCGDNMTEADAPPVRRLSDLEGTHGDLARTGYQAWQAGNLDKARESLERLLSSLNGNDDLAARFHALHLLACVAFSAQRYAESRTLHEEVLSMSRAIGFAGGSGSSL